MWSLIAGSRWRWSLIVGRFPGRKKNEIKNYRSTHIKRKLLSGGLDPQTHRSLCPPHNENTTVNSPPAPDHKILAFQSMRTTKIADFFQHDRLESSSVELTTYKDEDHFNLNLDLCTSLPSNSSLTENRTSNLDRTMDSNSMVLWERANIVKWIMSFSYNHLH